MRELYLFELLQQGYLIGFEESESEGDPSEDPDEENEEGSEDEDSNNSEENSESEGEKEPSKLKSALQKERRERRKLERELKKLQKAREEAEDKDKSEGEKAIQRATEAEAKAVRLAERLRDTAVDNLITKHATKLKFRDIDDALSLVNRAGIEVDQDEEDPADIEVDEGTVEAALKTLAKKKPHLLLGDGESGPSGGNLGSRSKDKDPLSDEVLMERYPALARGARPRN